MTRAFNPPGSLLRRSGLVLLALAALTSGAISGTAFAQDSGVAGDLERTATASPQEKLQYAADAVEELKQTLKSAEKLLEEARKDGETEQVECLAERISQIRALAQVTESAQGAMQKALEAGNTERADHEMRKIAVALSKSRQLSLEAQACVDESSLASGETQISVSGGMEGEVDETDPLDVDVLDQGYDPPQQSPFN